MGLTAQIGRKNSWTSLGHCLGTRPAKTGMTNQEAHLVALRASSTGVKCSPGSIPRRVPPRIKGKMIF